MAGDPIRPGREVGGRADLDLDADLLELGLQILGQGFLLLVGPGYVVDLQREACAVAVFGVSSLVQQGIGLVQVQPP